MKRTLILLILILYFCAYNAKGQSYVVASNSVPVTTQSNNGRYEFVQSTNNSTHAFLLDKFTGNVWRYKIVKKEFEELKREDPDCAIADKINYQIYISAENGSMCFLLNIHTGEMWRYSSGGGEKVFKKMSMPWHCMR